MSNIKYLIIDEILVVGQKMLGWIDTRCRQGTRNSKIPFGSISVIIVGQNIVSQKIR